MIGVVLLPVGRWHQHLDVLAQHFPGGIAKCPSAALLNAVMRPARSMRMTPSMMLVHGGRCRTLAGNDADHRLDAQVEQQGLHRLVQVVVGAGHEAVEQVRPRRGGR